MYKDGTHAHGFRDVGLGLDIMLTSGILKIWNFGILVIAAWESKSEDPVLFFYFLFSFHYSTVLLLHYSSSSRLVNLSYFYSPEIMFQDFLG